MEKKSTHAVDIVNMMWYDFRVISELKDLNLKNMAQPLEWSHRDPAENMILGMKYRGGLGHPQKGKFMVIATFLGMGGKPKGGGWVESFDSKEDAENCVQEINNINPDHAPTIHPVEK